MRPKRACEPPAPGDGYIEELRSRRPRLTARRRRTRDDTLTLVYSAQDTKHNDAVVLAEVPRRVFPSGDSGQR